MARPAAERRWNAETLRLVPRMERAAVRVVPLGPRVVLELLLEIGCAHDCVADVANRLCSYSRMTPELVRAVGADRIAPRRPVLVPDKRAAP